MITCEPLNDFPETFRLACDGRTAFIEHHGCDPSTVLAIYRQWLKSSRLADRLDAHFVECTQAVIDLVRSPDSMKRVRKAACGVLIDSSGDDMTDRCPDWLLAWSDVFVREWLADYVRSQEPLSIWRGSSVVVQSGALIDRACEQVEEALKAVGIEQTAAA